MNPPSWRRLLGSSGALFLIIGAFLAGRVHAGSDPALKSKQPQTQTQPQAQVQQQSSDQGFDDGFGAAPAPDVNPPVTQAS